ncbi:SpoIID/LytB domain-containing protein, partial [Candidatus Cyanaurora vandensis]
MVWVIVGGFLWALGLACGAAPLDIGIFQRFGENLEQATVQAVGEQPLTVVTSEQRQFQTRRLKIQTTRVPLTTPMPWSRVMVSAHRSFEDAQGVARTLAHLNPAIVRPQRWQVWVMRQATPPTPAQAQLVTQLQQNYPTARVESGLQTEEVVLDLNQQYRARQVTIQAPNNRVKFGTRLYGGNLRLMPNSYGTYSVINRVDLQTYLRGVVPYEIAPVAPYQAIKAQAVVARTFALRNLKRFSFDGYDL